MNKYTSNSFKGCVLEVDLRYPKELRKLHTDYSLAPDKIEIKRERLSEYQLEISDLHNIPIGNVKKYAIYGKTMKNLRNRINIKLLHNQKDYSKRTSKPSYMSHKIFGNNVVAIRQNLH